MNEVTETRMEFAERLNGRVAMIGIMFAFLSEATTNTLFFGLF
jgi:hypothetical protein